MKKNLPSILIGFFTVVIIAGLFILAAKQPSSTSTTTSGQPLKQSQSEINFTLNDLSNKPVTLSSFKGKDAVLVEFFAVWCPHCQNEAPIIESLAQQYNNKGIQFLNVQASPYGKNYETGDMTTATIDDLKWFRDKFGITYPILQDQSIATANKYGVQGFPTFYIIDKNGKVTFTTSGETTQDTLISEINKVLNG